MPDAPFIARGFRARTVRPAEASRLPPGQYETTDFPVLSAGPTPRTQLATWDFTIRDADGRLARWSWDELQSLPRETPTVDIHCVTKWSKFGTKWEGVSIDTLFAASAARGVDTGAFVVALCDGGYTTNLALPTSLYGGGRVHVHAQGTPRVDGLSTPHRPRDVGVGELEPCRRA